MAFGQASGSPASGKQTQELLALLNAAGHTSFRDARGPMGFTQRQAGGKFSRDEAEAFIEQLHEAEEAEGGDDGSPAAAPAIKTSAAERALQAMPAGQLAAELQRRGWIVVEPA
jgi:hypothetical protein